jgi:hypothetical protein
LGKGGASPLSSCLAGVKLLEIVEYHGSYLLRNGFFQMQGGKAYVSRIRDYKGSAQHLLGASDSELRITYEEDTYRKIGTTSLLDISFTWQTKEERVGGILTLAIVEFSKSACW